MFGWPYHAAGGAWFFGILAWLFWIAIIVLIVFFVVRLLRPGTTWPGPGNHPLLPDAAEEILHRRLANGEIEVDEYERRMAALRAQRPPRR